MKRQVEMLKDESREVGAIKRQMDAMSAQLEKMKDDHRAQWKDISRSVMNTFRDQDRVAERDFQMR